MQIKVVVVGQRLEKYSWKRGKGVHHLLLCMDVDKEIRLENLFDYVMTPDEAEEYFGRLEEKIVLLAVSSLEPTFGWGFRAKGKMTVLSPLKPRAVESEQRT